MAYVRKYKTVSGKTGVEVLWKMRGEIVKREYVGSAGDQKELEKCLKEARKIIDGGKTPLFDLSEYDKI